MTKELEGPQIVAALCGLHPKVALLRGPPVVKDARGQLWLPAAGGWEGLPAEELEELVEAQEAMYLGPLPWLSGKVVLAMGKGRELLGADITSGLDQSLLEVVERREGVAICLVDEEGEQRLRYDWATRAYNAASAAARGQDWSKSLQLASWSIAVDDQLRPPRVALVCCAYEALGDQNRADLWLGLVERSCGAERRAAVLREMKERREIPALSGRSAPPLPQPRRRNHLALVGAQDLLRRAA
jgi:hypothetical protein